MVSYAQESGKRTAERTQGRKAQESQARHHYSYRICGKADSQYTENGRESKHGIMNDQTAKADAGKLQITLVPTQIIKDIAEVRMYGNAKYHDPDNWKQVEVQRYRDALCRHLLEYIKDPKSVDSESKIPHYKHMACNMAFICEMESEQCTTI